MVHDSDLINTSMRLSDPEPHRPRDGWGAVAIHHSNGPRDFAAVSRTATIHSTVCLATPPSLPRLAPRSWIFGRG